MPLPKDFIQEARWLIDKDPKSLHSLGQYIQTMVFLYSSLSYSQAAKRIDIVGVNKYTLSSWVRSNNPDNMGNQVQTLAVANIRYECREIIKKIERGGSPINKRAQFIQQLDLGIKKVIQHNNFSIDSHDGNRKYFINPKGIVKKTAELLHLERHDLTRIEAILRYEMLQREKRQTSGNRDAFVESYIDKIKFVGTCLAKLPRKTRKERVNSPENFKLAANQLSHIESIEEFEDAKIPLEWRNIVFMNSRNIIFPLYSGTFEFTSTEKFILREISRGENIVNIGKRIGIDNTAGVVWVNLLLKGKP